MLYFKVLNNKKHIKLVNFSNNFEKNDLFSFFKRKSKLSQFNILVKRGIWDGMDSFISKDGIIPIGLWKEIYNFSEKFGYDCEIEGINECLNLSINREDYLNYLNNDLLNEVYDEFGNKIIARDYQIEAAYRALKYKFCTEELATSAGKTLIFYIYNSYLKDYNIINSKNKALLIVPNVSLVSQTAEKFELYSKNRKNKWKIHIVGGENKFNIKKFEECEILITTYQSLINMTPFLIKSKLNQILKKSNKLKSDKNLNEIKRLKRNLEKFSKYNIFKFFKVVNIDEAHKSRGNSISEIIKSCENAEFKLGLSGTIKLDEFYSDFFKMQQNIGPLVMILSAKHLIDKGYSPNVLIKMIYLKYNEKDPFIIKYNDLKTNGKLMFNDPKKYGLYMSKIEKDFLINSKERLEFINNLIKNLKKNSLVLFSDIKNEYGQIICNKLKEWNENTFYIDGKIKSNIRDYYKNLMEKRDDVIIVASFGTFSTGIDLKNVHHIIFAESTKAEITIRQSIGRGMRKLSKKNKVVIWDIIDDFDSYSLKHSKIRENIYLNQKFKIIKHSIKIDNLNS